MTVPKITTQYNGNDLNWERLEGVNQVCTDCLRVQAEEGYDLLTDEQKERYHEEHEMDCEFHTNKVYFEHVSHPKLETTSLEMFENWYKHSVEHPGDVVNIQVYDFLDWYIVHDTNDNSIIIFGDYPEEVIREDRQREEE